MTILETMLKCDEGLRLAVYKDTLGNDTIGYGHCITFEENIPPVITLDEALDLLGKDIDRAIQGVLKALPWVGDLATVRQAVLFSMSFNMGLNGLLAFRHTLAAVKKGDYSEAAKQMLDSRWAHQVGFRAQKLAAIMLTGIMPDDYVNFNPEGV